MTTQILKKQPAFVPVILTVMILSSFGPAILLSRHYERICPRVPDERIGAIYSLDERGRIVYLTLEQHRVMLATDVYFGVSWILAVGVSVWMRPQPRMKGVSSPKNPA